MKKRLKDIATWTKSTIKQFWIYFLLIAALTAFDLITKKIFENEYHTVIKNFFYITYTENTGASFGMLKGQQTLFLIITPLAMLMFLGFMVGMKNTKTYFKVGMSFMLAGTLGNFIDRLAFGFVRDFAHIVFFGWDVPFLGKDFPIFNFADNFLTAGLIMFAVYLLFHYNPEQGKKDKASQSADEAGS